MWEAKPDVSEERPPVWQHALTPAAGELAPLVHVLHVFHELLQNNINLLNILQLASPPTARSFNHSSRVCRYAYPTAKESRAPRGTSRLPDNTWGIAQQIANPNHDGQKAQHNISNTQLPVSSNRTSHTGRTEVAQELAQNRDRMQRAVLSLPQIWRISTIWY